MIFIKPAFQFIANSYLWGINPAENRSNILARQPLAEAKKEMGKFLKKYRVVLILLLVTALGATAVLYNRSRNAGTASVFQTNKIERGTLTATIGATGTVRAKQTAVLIWQAAGTVDTVNVKVGDNVPAGFVMAYLSKSSLPQSIILAEADLVNAQRTLDDLLNSTAGLAQAEQNLAIAKQAVEDAQKDVTKLDFRRASDDLLDQTQAEIDLANKQITLAEQAYKAVKNRPDGDSLKAQALLNLTNARLERDKKIATLNWYLGTPSELDAARYRAALSVALAQEADAQREYDRLSAGNVAEIAAARARVEAAQATLNLARVTAPFAGIVTESYPLPGDQLGAGATAFRIDDMSSLLVDVNVSEVDINSVAIGQPVMLTFDAILGREYHGEVVEVAQTGTVSAGVVNFYVTVELIDADSFVKPGMTAAVNITVKELVDVLLVPNRAVRLSDGERVVYILENDLPVKKAIRLGSSSDTMSVLASGDVQEGDAVILNPPIEFMGPGGGGPFGN
ncbi:MAG TPA: efflux RND transporter periplasmic adaptor subunit [Anaerolineales bacterium]